MVLINNLTIDEINAALLHLQRSQGEVVGGTKGNTIQNISITNTSTGVDYSSQIARLEKNVEDLQRVDEELKDKDREIIEKLDALGLIGIGIDNLDFDPTTRVLSIFTTNGEEYTTTLASEEVSLTFDSTSNKLVFSMGEQTKEVTLPYINASEKGVANGVATLDDTGRVPYSQLPESAMELKGEWNADTNTPELKDGHGTNGDFYICNVGGTTNFGTSENPRTITFYVNDRVIYQGNVAQWKRLPASEVRTVNGQSGDVTLNGTNVKYSDANNSPTLKDKIDTVEGYAKTQSDWGQADTSAIDFIKNKPSLATVATSGSYNDLSNKPTIPAAQIQSDWTQTDNTKKDFIKNKIPIWITSGSADDNMSPIDSVTNGSMRPITSNAVADALNANVYTTLFGVSQYQTVTITPTTNFTALTEAKSVTFPVTKTYKIFASFWYKLLNTPPTLYQFMLQLRIDDTIYLLGSFATLDGYISFTGFTTAQISAGTHQITLGCKVADNQKVVNINVPFYNLMSFSAI